jgi:hypothetical protein
MIRAIGFGAVAFLALASARPVDAQLRLIPQVGLYSPFGQLPTPGAGVDEIKKEGTLAFGAALEIGTPDKVSFRVNLLHATDSDIPITDIGCNDDCARSSVTTATGTLAVRPLPRIIVAQPYLLLGGGLKRYDFTREDLDDEGWEAILNDQNQLTGHLGLGVELNLGLVNLVGEVSDLVSQFDTEGDISEQDELQHDVYFTVGLVIGG